MCCTVGAEIKETRIACLERRKKRNPEMFELLMKAVNGKRSIYDE